jgi:dTDP-4-dehydrorhamnose 3,5-epimerase
VTGPDNVEGVTLRALRTIPTDGGAVLHVLRQDDPEFGLVGEVYMSELASGACRDWKCYSHTTQRLSVARGAVEFMISDERQTSATFGRTTRVKLSRHGSYSLLTIAPGLWYTFRNLAYEGSLILNVPDRPHDPAEVQRRPGTPEAFDV